MKKMENLHGAIFAVDLLKSLGVAYVRMVIPELVLGKHTAGILLKILDEYDTKQVPAKETIHQEQMMHPLLLFDVPGKEEAVHWKLIGKVAIEADYCIPDFMYCSNKNLGKPERFERYTWQLVREMGHQPYQKARFERGKHLGTWEHISPALARGRITMAWMRHLGLDITEYFRAELTEPGFRAMYNRTVYFPSYREIPANMRGKYSTDQAT